MSGEGWQPIEGAPFGESVIVTDGVGWMAVAHCTNQRGHLVGDPADERNWWLGHATDHFEEGLDFDPTHWLPWAYDANPLFAPFADGRPPMRTRAAPAQGCNRA